MPKKRKSNVKWKGSRQAGVGTPWVSPSGRPEVDAPLSSLINENIESIKSRISELVGSDSDCVSRADKQFEKIKRMQQQFLQPGDVGQPRPDLRFARRSGNLLDQLSEQVRLLQHKGVDFKHEGLKRFMDDTSGILDEEVNSFKRSISPEDSRSGNEFPKLVKIEINRLCMLSTPGMPSSDGFYNLDQILLPVFEVLDMIQRVLFVGIPERKHNYHYFYYLASAFSCVGLLLSHVYTWNNYNETVLKGVRLFSSFFQAVSVAIMPFVHLQCRESSSPDYIVQDNIRYLSDFLSDLITDKNHALGVRLLNCPYIRNVVKHGHGSLLVERLQYSRICLEFMRKYPTKEERRETQKIYQRHFDLLLSHSSDANNHLAYECNSADFFHAEGFLIESVYELGQLYFEQGENHKGMEVYKKFVNVHDCFLCSDSCEISNHFYVDHSIKILITLIGHTIRYRKKSHEGAQVVVKGVDFDESDLDKWLAMLRFLTEKKELMNYTPESRGIVSAARSILKGISCGDSRPTFDRFALYLRESCSDLENMIGEFETKMGDIRRQAEAMSSILREMFSCSDMCAFSLDEVFDYFMPLFKLRVLKSYFFNFQLEIEKYFCFRSNLFDEKAYRPWMVWAKMGCGNPGVMLLSLSKLKATLEIHQSPNSFMMLYWLCQIHYSFVSSELYALANKDVIEACDMLMRLCQNILRAAPTNLQLIVDSSGAGHNFREFVTSLYYIKLVVASSEVKASISSLIERLVSKCHEPAMCVKLQKSSQGNPILSNLHEAVQRGFHDIFIGQEVVVASESQVVSGMPPVDIVLEVGHERVFVQVDGPQHYDIDLQSEDQCSLVLRTKDAMRDWIYAQLGHHVIRLKWHELSEYMRLDNGSGGKLLTGRNSLVVLAELLLKKYYSLMRSDGPVARQKPALVRLLQAYILQNDLPELIGGSQGIVVLKRMVDLMPPLNLSSLVAKTQLWRHDECLLQKNGLFKEDGGKRLGSSQVARKAAGAYFG